MPSSDLRKLFPWFIATGLVVGGLVILAFYQDQFPEWKDWQRAYIKQELARATNDAQRTLTASTPIAIKQIVLADIGRIDRCTTCHVTVEDASYSGFKPPLTYHPNHAQHPFEKFGCTICHQGQGLATTRPAAHGHIEHWEHPMLPMKYIQSACAKCHFASDVPGAPKLARGRALFEETGCIGCHKLKGVGGVIGPELEGVGARRSPEWLSKHFRVPAEVTPGSAMPPVKVSEDDVDALTLYMLSLTDERLNAYLVSMKMLPGPEAGQRLFLEKGCIGCHSLGGQGGKVGPALEGIATRHNASWIAAHFRNPPALTPGTLMPNFDFSEVQIRALTEFLLTKTEPGVVGFLKLPALLTPIERGKAVFKKFGCIGCHGRDALGGVPNPNAKTKQQVPGLKFVSEGYNKAELRKRILGGQKEINKLDLKGPQPPLYMPGWAGKISDGELADLVEYLMSLLPKEEKTEF